MPAIARRPTERGADGGATHKNEASGTTQTASFVAMFLSTCKLNDKYVKPLEELGFAEFDDFVEAEHSLYADVGLTTVEVKRLNRYVENEQERRNQKALEKASRRSRQKAPAAKKRNRRRPSSWSGSGVPGPQKTQAATKKNSGGKSGKSLKEKLLATWKRMNDYQFPGAIETQEKEGDGEERYPEDLLHSETPGGTSKSSRDLTRLGDKTIVSGRSTVSAGTTERTHVIGRICNATSSGTFLTLHALRRIRITGLACGTPYKDLEDWQLVIYTREGGARGHEHSSEDWTVLAKQNGAVENGGEKPLMKFTSKYFIRFSTPLLVEKGSATGFYLHSSASNYAIVDCLVEKAKLANEDLRLEAEYRHDDSEPFNMKTCVDRRYVPAVCIHYELGEPDEVD